MVLIVYSFKIFAVIFTIVIVPTSSSYDGSQKVFLICRVTFYLSLIKLDCRLAQFARNMLRAQIVQFTQRRDHHATVVSLDSLKQDFVEIQGFEYVDL